MKKTLFSLCCIEHYNVDEDFMIHTLHTKRLMLRQWKDSDFAAFAKMNADEEVMQYFPNTLTEIQSDHFASTLKSLISTRGWGLWAVELTHAEGGLLPAEFIGFVGLHQPDVELPFIQGEQCTEIGWRLDKKYWHQGIACEAATAVLTFAFETLKLPKVISFTSNRNQPSKKLMQRIGMSDLKQNFKHPALPDHHELAEHVLYEIKPAY
jgi:RimJ/RimL family protein N-acetyltransferase